MGGEKSCLFEIFFTAVPSSLFLSPLDCFWPFQFILRLCLPYSFRLIIYTNCFHCKFLHLLVMIPSFGNYANPLAIRSNHFLPFPVLRNKIYVRKYIPCNYNSSIICIGNSISSF